MSPARHGPEVELGEAQWAILPGDPRAHWYAIAKSDPDWVVASCGDAIVKPSLFHPGTMPLCARCARRHNRPTLSIDAGALRWLHRPTAPPEADRTRPLQNRD